MGLGFIGLSIWQSDRSDRENKRVSRKHQEEQIRNEGNIKFVQGQLQSIQLIMGNLSKTGWPGMNEMAAAVAQILRQNQQAAELTNKQACDRAIGLAKRIRDFQGKFETEQRVDDQRLLNATTQQERQAAWVQRSQDTMRRYQEHDMQFRNGFVADAKYLKDWMLDKLSPEKREMLVRNNQQAEGNLNLGLLAGAFNENGIANYLEEIAKTFCPQAGH